VTRITQVEISGVTFRIVPFDPFRQLELFGNLQKEILPAVGGVLNVAFGKGGEDEGTDRAAIEAFRDLSTRFDGATLKKWADLLIEPDFVTFEREGREPQKMSKAMRGDALTDFADVLELMFHIGKVNFADPLQRWAGLSGLAQKVLAKMSDGSAKTSSTSL